MRPEKVPTGACWTARRNDSSERITFAFLVAVAFDRGMPWQKAWRIPVEIDHAGYLDSAKLASMSELDLTTQPDCLACPLTHVCAKRT